MFDKDVCVVGVAVMDVAWMLAGRTGRAGRLGRAITFFTEDVVNLRSIANVMRASGCDIPQWMLHIKKPSK